ncbi:hypothetical protein BC629DRAFT_313163 [Irpex lacteus]|nr:hypothetical protein BC629DRAFT_313163 [Irpex lacteus]
MPIQLPDDSLLTFHPPSAGIPCGTDDHNDKFPTFGFHILSPGTPTFYGGYGSLNQPRNIVARTSHTSGLEELQEGYPQLSPNPSPSEISHTISTSRSFTTHPDERCHSILAQPEATISTGFVMPKKRRSLQAILVPPFFQSAMAAEGIMAPPTPTSTTRLRSHSAAASTSSYVLPPAIPIPPMPETRSRPEPLRNSPPSDLLDDDPFADLSPAPAVTLFAEASASQISLPSLSPKIDTSVAATGSLKTFPTPRSPLAGDSIDATYERGGRWPVPPRTPPSTPILGYSAMPSTRRPRSSGNGQARSAYARPAFRSRPSLPSLHSLAQMHVIAPKVKRGRVGAQLPAEPWESTSSSDTDSYDDHDSDSRRSSGLSTIRDSRLYASECDDESIDNSSLDDSCQDEDEIVRSTTPRASEANTLGSRPNPLVRAQSDPTPSRSTSSLSFSSDAPDFSDEIVSSPETSFPSTPQLPVSIPGHASSHGPEGYQYIPDRFPRQATHSIYDDLAATLDYDYSQAISQLHRRPSTLGIGISGVATSTQREEEGDCDFEPGTSARTIRSPFQTDHQRTPSTQSISLEWTTEMDVNPLSPISTGSFVSSETASSGTSSDYGEEVDFLSFHSDSDEDSDGGSSEYISALGILPEAGARPDSPTRPSRPFVRRRIVAGEEVEVEMSDSSGADITARLGQLDPSETESSTYASAPEEMVDSEGGRRGGYSGSRNVSSEYSRSHAGNGYGGSHGGGSGGADGYGGGAGGGRRGGGGGDDDWNRRPPPRTSVPARNDTDTDEDEESSDDESEVKPAARRRRCLQH